MKKIQLKQLIKEIVRGIKSVSYRKNLLKQGESILQNTYKTIEKNTGEPIPTDREREMRRKYILKTVFNKS